MTVAPRPVHDECSARLLLGPTVTAAGASEQGAPTEIEHGAGEFSVNVPARTARRPGHAVGTPAGPPPGERRRGPPGQVERLDSARSVDERGQGARDGGQAELAGDRMTRGLTGQVSFSRPRTTSPSGHVPSPRASTTPAPRCPRRRPGPRARPASRKPSRRAATCRDSRRPGHRLPREPGGCRAPRRAGYPWAPPPPQGARRSRHAEQVRPGSSGVPTAANRSSPSSASTATWAKVAAFDSRVGRSSPTSLARIPAGRQDAPR